MTCVLTSSKVSWISRYTDLLSIECVVDIYHDVILFLTELLVSRIATREQNKGGCPKDK